MHDMMPDRAGGSRPTGRRGHPSPRTAELEALRNQLAAARRRIATLLEVRRRSRRAIRRLASMATTDVLTGLGNRRQFEAVLGACHAASARRGWPLSVIMVDVDGFKSYNDAYGHAAGDEVLCTIARRLRASTRDRDVVTRYGGEEFAIVLPGVDAIGAIAHAERQRIAIESFAWPLRPVTASFGVATRPPSTGDLAALVGEADRALYASKWAGRNRVIHLGLVDGGEIPARVDDRPAPGGHAIPDAPEPTLHRPWLPRPVRRGAQVGDGWAGSSQP